MSVRVEGPPRCLETEYATIFTSDSLKFLGDLVTEFELKVENVLMKRELRRLEILEGKWKPKAQIASGGSWTVAEIPQRIRNRKLDLGDISPANTALFVDALFSDVQGVQVDFDDGHCPTWRNTIQGIYNVAMAAQSRLRNGPASIENAPILWMRPRALNMIEHHCMINGKEVSGPLFDFALLMFHTGKMLFDKQIGPFFYLSKIEDSCESALWNDMFVWSQTRLSIPQRTIKACILIENILSVYCMEDILYSIREHTIGLNCGIWDYSASIIAKFGNQPKFLLPDRNKYVNVTKPFLSAYMRLVVATCHRRNALATGGMAAQILPPGKGVDAQSLEIVKKVCDAKRREILFGVDGFMVHDLRIVPHVKQLWAEMCPDENQMSRVPDVTDITDNILLELPSGGVTIDGLKHNISVAILFIYHWLSGSGIFFYNGAVEDSATAEISRSQIWQWIRFSAQIEDNPEHPTVTRQQVYAYLDEIVSNLRRTMCETTADAKRLTSAKFLLLEIVSSKQCIEYLTTFLNDNHKFRAVHNKNDGLKNKL